MAKKRETQHVLHLVMVFAEKVLLTSLLRQSGQMHFTTGLNFDILWISCSNLNTNFVFGLPEGHFPNGKSADQTIHMLFNILQLAKNYSRTKYARHLVVHADNCSGKNKNRFVFWFAAWLVMRKVFSKVEIMFLVAGHTKNVCDGAFGSVKRLFRARNVHSPKEIMQVIEKSARTTSCISSSQIDWLRWREILPKFFVMPNTLRIMKNLVFSFRSETPGTIFVKDYSTSLSEVCHYLLTDMSRADIIADEVQKALNCPRYKNTWTDLHNLPSKRHGTRREYLRKEILESYFKNDEELEADFFVNGSSDLAPLEFELSSVSYHT